MTIHRGLLARVVLHGIALLLVNAIGFLVLVAIYAGPRLEHDMRAFTEWFGRDACARARAPDVRQQFDRYPVPVALFELGNPNPNVTSSLYVAQAPPTEPRLEPAGSPTWNRPGSPLVMRCPDAPSSYVVVGGELGIATGQLAMLVAMLVLLAAVGSIPLARSLIGPLRELVRVTTRFGQGELTVRAEVTRRDEIGDLAAAFNTMATNLHRRRMAEMELLANISHELRTPLARVRVVFETAREDPSRAGQLLEEIARDLADLERLTDDVLATLRLDFEDAAREPATIRSRPEPVDVLTIVRRAITRAVEGDPTIEIALEASGKLPAIEGDPALLLRLFANLIDNAWKYSHTNVVVRVTCKGSAIEVEVEDHGIGIAATDVERVFEPFFRADRSRSTNGTGLGLTLCQRIVVAHGGTIRVRSDPEIGTVVSVVLVPRVSSSTEAA